MLGNLFMVPIYLSYWSTTIYGEWLALVSLATYLFTLNFGMHGAIINRLTQAYALHNLDDYARWQHSALAFFLMIALMGSVLLGVALYFWPITRWIGVQETSLVTAKWAVWFLGLQFLWTIPFSIFLNFYRTAGSLYRTQWISNFQQLLTMALAVLVLALGGQMSGVALAQVLALVLVFIFLCWELKKNSPHLFPGLSRARLSVIRELIPPSLDFGKLTLGSAAVFQMPVILISATWGGVAVAVYATSRTLVNLIFQALTTLGNALWPDLTGLEALGQYDRLRQIHRLLTTVSTILCIAIAGALWFEGDRVISFWTRGKVEPDIILLRLFVLYLLLEVPWLASGYFQIAANKLRRYSWLYLLSKLLGLGLAILCMDRLGTWAFPLGIMIGESIAGYFFIIRDTCKMLMEPYGPYTLRLVLAFVPTCACSFLVGWITHTLIPGPDMLRWVLMGFCTTIASVAAGWVVWLTPGDRAAVVEKVRPVIHFLSQCSIMKTR